MMKSGWRVAKCLAAAGVLMMGLGPAVSNAEELASVVVRVDSEVRTYDGQLNQIRSQSLVAEDAIRDYSFATSFVDARYQFNVGHYGDAVGVLIPLVEDESNQQNAGYNEAGDWDPARRTEASAAKAKAKGAAKRKGRSGGS